MNAKTVQKWIRKNAPEYRLVRTQYIEKLQAETTRADLAENLVRSLGVELEAESGELTDENDRLVSEVLDLRRGLVNGANEYAELLAEAELLRGFAAAHDLIPDRRAGLSRDHMDTISGEGDG